MDEFDQALLHDKIEPRCTLLAEIHGSLLAVVTQDSIRIPGTVSATASGIIPRFSAEKPDSEGARIPQEEKENYIRLALEYSRKWDRSKRLNSSTARVGWERHLVGCLVQVSST